jgi:hypothetical protein
MLPKTHILLGIIFSVLVYFLFHLTIFQASLILLASVLIDVDHYMFIVKRKKIWNLKKAYYWHKTLPKDHKTMMHIFHTIEFMFLVLIISYFWNLFFFIFIGMLFHSILDLIDLFYNCKFGVREFSCIRYILRDKDKYF